MFSTKWPAYLSRITDNGGGGLNSGLPLVVVLLLGLRDESAVEDGGRLKDELVEAERVFAAHDLAQFGEKGRLWRKAMMAMLI